MKTNNILPLAGVAVLCVASPALLSAEKPLLFHDKRVEGIGEGAVQAGDPAARTRTYDENITGMRPSVVKDEGHDGFSSHDGSGQSWGIAAAERVASMPFATERETDTVNSFVPLLFFENDLVFLRGTEGGIYLFNDAEIPIQISGLTRLRFVDIPTKAQDASQADPIDYGLQLRYRQPRLGTVDFEVMSDRKYRLHGNIRLKGVYAVGNWTLSPSLTVRYKDSDFNTAYYTLADIHAPDIGGGVDVSAGMDARYRVGANVHLLGGFSITRLDHQAYQVPSVKDRYTGEVFFGLGFFENQSSVHESALTNARYLRIAHGWATPSNLGDIVTLKTEKDPHHNQLTSFFYGHPLVDDLLGLPLDVYLTPGIVHHWSSSTQSAGTEYVAAIKAYYTFDWPTRWRFGLAEGISYIDNVTYVEATDMQEKGYAPSRLLNYLDLSLDVNIGDLFDRSKWRDIWVGYSLHHRSGIFEKSSQYGGIKGGSNYNTVYMQLGF